jgi:TolB-like protein
MAGAPSGPTLVVMPFANLGEGPEARIYAQGLTEEGLGQLARFKELSVLGRETSRSIPLDADVARIRRDLDVRYVLEGSVRTAAHQFRVVSRLLDAETGAVLWSQAYDDDLRVRGFFAIQDDVAQKASRLDLGRLSSLGGRKPALPSPRALHHVRQLEGVRSHNGRSNFRKCIADEMVEVVRRGVD